jgi:hypothetical protein
MAIFKFIQIYLFLRPWMYQELLEKRISLDLNVKRPLLERVSRCTRAQIASSIDNIASAKARPV